MPLHTELYVSFSEHLSGLIHNVQDMDSSFLLVACSGGVDSMTLLHLTHQYCLETGFRAAAVHVNHGVRQSARRDEEFVSSYCEKLGIPFLVGNLSDESGGTPEPTEGVLRERRYDVLFSFVREYKAVGLLVAHHADDQLETVLWRLLRGTSLTGIGGIRSFVLRQGVNVMRPLLKYPKAQIQEYADKRGVPYIVDETNQSDDYTRNALRHNVIPYLKEIQPKVLQAVTKFSQIVQEEDGWIEEKAEEVVEACTNFESGSAIVDLNQLHTFPVPLQRRAIKILLYCLASMEWTFEHVDSLLQLSNSKSPSARVQLPGGLTAWRIYDAVVVAHQDTPLLFPKGDSTEAVNWALSDGSSLSFPPHSVQSWQFFCERWSIPDALSMSVNEAVVPAVESVHIRTADTSERVQPLGIKGSKKLQDVFVDAKVPKQIRQLWPVVCAGNEIVWVPGILRTQAYLVPADVTVGWKLSVTVPILQRTTH